MLKCTSKSFTSGCNRAAFKEEIGNSHIEIVKLRRKDYPAFGSFLKRWHKTTNQGVLKNLEVFFHCRRTYPAISCYIRIIDDFSV